MQEADNPSPILETTEQAVRLARTLLRTARSGALATLEPATGWPVATRVGVSTDIDGAPVILISRLAAHTGALLADPRCSLLVGYPGKGDPLAHPRLSIACEAREVGRETPEHRRLDFRYLAHQQKAALYAGLGDFRYFRLEPNSAALNAGFGRAYRLQAGQLLSSSPANEALAAAEPDCIAELNADPAALGHLANAPQGNWRLVGIDAEGLDLADGDDVRRIWFDTPLTSLTELDQTITSALRRE